MQRWHALETHIHTWASAPGEGGCRSQTCMQLSQVWQICMGNVSTYHWSTYRSKITSACIQAEVQLQTGTCPLHTHIYTCAHSGTLQQYVCMCVYNRHRFCSWHSSWALGTEQTAALFRTYNAVFWLYNAANAGMCNTGCKSWQAKQFLFGSGYLTVICLWYNMPFCLVLRHHLLILSFVVVIFIFFSFYFFFCAFVLVFIILNMSAWIIRDPSPL